MSDHDDLVDWAIELENHALDLHEKINMWRVLGNYDLAVAQERLSEVRQVEERARLLRRVAKKVE